MADTGSNDLSVGDLIRELRAREAKSDDLSRGAAHEARDDLRDFDDESLTRMLLEQQAVIYGVDDRRDVYELEPGPDLDDADSVVALFAHGDVVDNGDGTSTLLTQSYGISLNLCPGEPFFDQPRKAFCSGVLVGPDLIATAGHCIDGSDLVEARFVFGFRMVDADTAQTTIRNSEIYRGVAILGRELVEDGTDWAVVRLDRPVANHRIAKVRPSGKIADGQSVHVIGHPKGLPTKFAAGAAVRDNTRDESFVANLDTYGGNSGSPVFNSETHLVEGLLVRGETDFVLQGDCNVSLVFPDTGGDGETVTRSSEFESLLPPEESAPAG